MIAFILFGEAYEISLPSGIRLDQIETHGAIHGREGPGVSPWVWPWVASVGASCVSSVI
jgi:hypothetical protein